MFVVSLSGLFFTLQVQLQNRIKQVAEQFRQWKASREKELLQVLQYPSLKKFAYL